MSKAASDASPFAANSPIPCPAIGRICLLFLSLHSVFFGEQRSLTRPDFWHCVSNSDIGKLARVLVVLLSLAWPSWTGHAGETEKLVRVSTQREKTSIRFLVENLQRADVTITFEMELTNLRGNVEFPLTTTIPGSSQVEVFNLMAIDASQGWNWEYTYYANYGSLDAVHEDAYVYSLPYAPGKAFQVTQGFNGEYSHYGPNQYAIDWRMPVGTPVHAAREGVVVAAKDDSNQGGADAKYDGDANFILIRHPDGTMGHYVHLQNGGNQVKVGQKVRAGDRIGRSGNTGHTTGPHLHFAVFKAKDGKERQSIPIRFKTGLATVSVLEPGRTYVAAAQLSRDGWVKKAADVLTLTPAVQ